MISSRREFLRTALIGSALFPLAGKVVPSHVFLPRDPASGGDLELLDQLERASFEFFWNEADPHTGLIRDRARADGGDTRHKSSIAATGFGLTALCIGAQRGYLSRSQIVERVRRTLQFLAYEMQHVHGFLYHFVDIETGQRLYSCEISPIDMAILTCGALTCRQYFQDKQISRDVATLYGRVEWPWALNGSDTFALSWKPEPGFSPLHWDGYCESMMLYLLAMGSSTYPIPALSWHKIRRPWLVYGNYRFISIRAPLFVHQFSHAWFDFRGKQDEYTNYFDNSVIACQAHRQFCQELSERFPCYSGKLWGITASDSSTGYVVWGGPPIQGPIDGTIVPAAAAGSLPFVFAESVSVLRNLRHYYGNQVWKQYGFVDAFNPLTGWVSRDVIGIDVGIGMLMAENARTQFVWHTFMSNAEANLGMERAGFRAMAALTAPRTSV
jgi:hypothetical protein